MALTHKRQVFLEGYLQCWNATEAARLAGYANPGSQGSRLLKNVEIQQAIQDRFKKFQLESDEVLYRLALQARGSIHNFLKIEENSFSFDLKKAEEAHSLGLVKKISKTPLEYGTRIDIELYDSQKALELVGKHFGLFTNKVDITSQGESIKLYAGVSPDDWDDVDPKDI